MWERVILRVCLWFLSLCFCICITSYCACVTVCLCVSFCLYVYICLFLFVFWIRSPLFDCLIVYWFVYFCVYVWMCLLVCLWNKKMNQWRHQRFFYIFVQNKRPDVDNKPSGIERLELSEVLILKAILPIIYQ